MARRCLAVVSAVLAGCASQAATPGQDLLATPARAEGYQLSKAELAYDCAKLAGHMRIRIAQLRGTTDRDSTTIASRAMHQSVTILGVSERGADPKADLARDRQMLDAFNRQLAAKNCKPLDIEAEMKGQPTEGGGKPANSKPKAASPAPAAGKG